MFMNRKNGSLAHPKMITPCLFFYALTFLLGCAPRIVNFVPERGPEGTEVTITGERFGETVEENTVKFGEVMATDVTLPEPNKIVAKVPNGAITSLISITTEDGIGYSDKDFVVPDGAKWTFMVYLDADNNLEGAGLNDFLEMATVGSSADINIVVQMDRVSGHSPLHGDWTDTRRFLIQKDDTPSTAPVQNLGEQNMGDPAVLQDFVEWGVTNYPAERYALVIWNHGDGWRVLVEENDRRVRAARTRGESAWGVVKAVAVDETSNYDKLFMKEVQQALETAKQGLEERLNTVVKLDVVGFDACLMGMVEVAYALRNVANYMVGSEQTEPGPGWPYDKILSALAATPSFSPKDLAGVIPTEYVNSYQGSSNITQSAVDIAKLNNLIVEINDFANEMNTEWPALKTARDDSLRYNHWCPSNVCWGVDLWHFADNTYNQVSSQNIKSAALDVKNSINDFVVNDRHSSDMAGSHGIAIYFPSDLSEFTNDPDHTGYEQNNQNYPLDFVTFHNWDEWLQLFYANLGAT